MTRFLQAFLIAGLFCWLIPHWTFADLVVSPTYSEVNTLARINQNDNQQVFSQTTTILPLLATASNSGQDTSLTVDTAMQWVGGPDRLNMNLDYLRVSSGSGNSFSGFGTTRYDFTVSEDTTVTINYSALFTTTRSGFPPADWWALATGLALDGNSVISLFPGDHNGFQSDFAGEAEFFLTAGSHSIIANIGGGSNGDFPATRTIAADFNIQIGQAMIPEPNSVGWLLLCSVTLLGCRRQRFKSLS